MKVLHMMDLALQGKRVLMREDLNVPIKNGVITSDARIQASLPSIQHALKSGAKVLLLSHLGRPVEGEYSEEFSLAPVAKRLSELLGCPVPLLRDCFAPIELKDGAIALCENVRFLKGEKKNDLDLGRRYAALCDIFVMDAFGSAHRAQATTSAVARFAPIACAGPLLAAEVDALEKGLNNPARPLVAILGGAKVSTKLLALESLCSKVNTLILGGGMANTLLLAMGYDVGKSLCEPDLVPQALQLLETAKSTGCSIPLPTDVIVGTEFSDTSPATIKKIAAVTAEDMILDIGPESIRSYHDILQQAGSILWNGPVGAFELEAFSKGTEAMCKSIAASKAFSIAGGGDTLAAITKYAVADKIDYMSTGGGAFLEVLEGKILPAVAELEARASK